MGGPSPWGTGAEPGKPYEDEGGGCKGGALWGCSAAVSGVTMWPIWRLTNRTRCVWDERRVGIGKEHEAWRCWQEENRAT
ncbi:hypothetical protein E2562_034520 [Oryza meyeriana var. granulata]|uniref:Uncharacterized protein n=1 Tax=Oryza meyeriana var. granulata TaxID=110450 RepID=A0A6G1CWD4_9ORYZ|nr:hypothetical protein E2562_034520 [Oryza meyeriana var. granulata]